MNRRMIIIGHGISGCVMAMTLFRKNIPFQIVGTSLPGEASPASSGLIAPVTGRRYVKAWNIETYIPAAKEFYEWTEDLIGKKYFHEIEIVRFLANEEANKAWTHRSRDPEYAKYISTRSYEDLDRLHRPYGILTGGYRLDTPAWLDAMRTFLMEKNLLEIVEQPIRMEHDKPGIFILATGAVDQKFAHGIIPNKGEALIVRMPDWNIQLIVKDEVFIVPLHDDVYWIGSYYQPKDDDPFPTIEGKEQLLKGISKLYAGPIEVLEHLAGTRPTVQDRRPIIGLLPGKHNQFLFNGMGTKATSLAPYWADQLISHILNGVSLPKEVSPARY